MLNTGLFLPTFRHWCDIDALQILLTRCEERGLDSVWLPDRIAFPVGDDDSARVRKMSTWLKDTSRTEDHWGQHGGGYRADEKVGEAFRDVYVMAGLVAGLSRRLRIGTSVALVPHRNPITSARTIATLDHLTDGRLSWGVGTGHVRGEYDALGLDYAERHAMLDEWLECIAALWTQDPAQFHGAHHDFADLRMLMPPVVSPRPPVMIGGNGKRALRTAARFGGGWVPAYLRPEELAVGMDYLREQMTAAGVPDEPNVALLSRFRLAEQSTTDAGATTRPVYTPNEFAEIIGQFDAVGCGTVIAHVPTRDLDTMLEQVDLLAAARDAALVGLR